MTRPTSVRIVIAGFLTLMACLLYLDRYAVGIASESMRVDLKMTQTQMSWFLSAFFWSYALCQVPAGWLSDRFGPRIVLTAYILCWSLFTGLLGVTTQVGLVLLLRLLCGAAQAGAYPVCSGMLRHWFPVSRRGAASSIVAMGGRSGAVLAPILTAALMTVFAGGWRPVLIVYGLIGIVVAFLFAWICRDSPHSHPHCNQAERELITGHTPIVAKSLSFEEPQRSSVMDESSTTDNPYSVSEIDRLALTSQQIRSIHLMNPITRPRISPDRSADQHEPVGKFNDSIPDEHRVAVRCDVASTLFGQRASSAIAGAGDYDSHTHRCRHCRHAVRWLVD
jgi:hypothetical protein